MFPLLEEIAGQTALKGGAMQKVYFMSADGELFDRKTGTTLPASEAGRIVAVCGLRPEDVVEPFVYLAVVDVPSGKQDLARVAAEDRKPEPVDVPLIRQALPAVMIVNRRNLHVVN